MPHPPLSAWLLSCAALSAGDAAEAKDLGHPTIFGFVQVGEKHRAAAVEEGSAAHHAARAVLGLSNVQFRIADPGYTSLRWGQRSPDGLAIYVWLFERSSGVPQPPPTPLLRHEIGHDLFIKYLVPSTKSAQYGGDAPDWLDEMAAIAFESEPMRVMRRRAAARYARDRKLIPLERFLSMAHPEMESGTIAASTGSLATAFEPASSETAQFYAMASAFYDYLVARTNRPSIVAELADAVRGEQDLELWLLRRTGVAGGLKTLERDFLTWIATDPRYGGGAR